MKWTRRMFALEADPNGSSQEPGILHQITLTDTYEGKPPFKYSTMMYIPTSLDEPARRVSLELFEDSAHTQLEQMRQEWLGRDVVTTSFIV